MARSAGGSTPCAPAEPWLGAYHGAALLRTPAAVRSVVARAFAGPTRPNARNFHETGPAALCVPADRSDMAEWSGNLFAFVGLRGPKHQGTATVEEMPGGFRALHLQIPNDVYNGCRRTYVGEGSSEIIIDGALAVRSLSGRTLVVFRPAAQGALTYNGLTSLRIEEGCTAVHEESLHLLPGDILCDENYEVEVLPVDGGWLAR